LSIADLSSLLYWKPGLHPPLFAFWIVRYVGVAHRGQFTGSIFTGVSMRVRAVGDDLSILVDQQLRSEFLDPLRGKVQA
jgi:hypothetical protein